MNGGLGCSCQKSHSWIAEQRMAASESESDGPGFLHRAVPLRQTLS